MSAVRAADCDVVVCYGGAKLTDKHLASTVHCVDDEIIGWLKRREQLVYRSKWKLSQRSSFVVLRSSEARRSACRSSPAFLTNVSQTRST
jgi:hypothetical protein